MTPEIDTLLDRYDVMVQRQQDTVAAWRAVALAAVQAAARLHVEIARLEATIAHLREEQARYVRQQLR